MTGCIVRYFEVGDKGVLIQHKEEYPTKLSGRFNYWLACRDPRKRNVTIEYVERRKK
jgi:hypothetical protein